MKFQAFLLTTILLAVVSCSKKDDPVVIANPPPAGTVGDDIVTNYLNLATANSWTYNTSRETVTPLPAATTNGIDILTVGGNYIFPANNKSYKTMTASTTTGFYCSMLKDNYLRVDGSSVKMTGKFKFSLGTNNLEFPVTDFVLFKENAAVNTELGTPATGNTVLNIPNVSYPITVNYSIKAVAGGDSASITSNSMIYNNIKKVVLTITIDANATLPAPFGLNQVLAPTSQDVIVSTQYYSKNNGLIKADTKIKYTVNPLITQFAPTFPASGEQNITDILFSKNF